MLTRRDFAARIGVAAAGRMLPEMAYAQRAAVNAAGLPGDVVWLNANENPAGVPEVALAAMREALPGSFRYHYQEFGAIYAAIAKSEDLAPEQIVAGCGSSEVLHTAVDAFTSPRGRSLASRRQYQSHRNGPGAGPRRGSGETARRLHRRCPRPCGGGR